MARLFGKNKLHERAQDISRQQLLDCLAIVKPWQEDYYSGSLLRDKETSREQAYNQDFFMKVLGYREKPNIPYTFEPKATTELRQLPDALIGYHDSQHANISAVVELKGASVDLDRPQRREGNFSPVQQGFKYKTQYRTCPFVIVSNFWELRLYNDNQLDYESWTLDELIDQADDYIRCRTFLYLLSSENFTCPQGPSKTELLLSDVRIHQEEIGRTFYQDYKRARLELLRDIYVKNENVRQDFDLAIEKAQTVIDRLVFSCFAEDRGLLPDDIVQRVVNYADQSAFDAKLWSTLKGFFEAIDTGSKRLEIPDGYNGGLFANDPVLNDLKIGDEALRGITSLSRYNFTEDLSVNILGHIFEQSISDLEDIKSKVYKAHDIKAVVETEVNAMGRRKKEGIFYTPDYIVRYIVENTLGSYLRSKEEECIAKYRLKEDIQDKTYIKREQQAYLQYQYILQNVKVLDPACGSGAFLVHVFDYLLAENRRVDAILGGTLSTEDYVRDILRDNIYGVDLNEESVEITKLSLWLKTAQRGKKLTALDQTIRCGNSLVDDPKYAGSKAFRWADEFGEVFSKGGFNVVVGNPPYVRSRDNMLDDIKDFIYARFENLYEKPNTYLLFMEQCKRLLNAGGKLGLVVPNSWLGMASAEKTRRMFLTEMTLERFVDLKGESFKGINVETVIFICTNTPPSIDHKILHQTVDRPVIDSTDYQQVEQSRWQNTNNVIFDLKSDAGEFHLMDSLASVEFRVEDFFEVRVGLQAYERGRGTPPQSAADVRDHVFDYRSKYDETTYPYLEGRDVGRYDLSWSGQWLRYGEWLSQPKDPSLFTGPRILIREITGKFPTVLLGTYVEDTYLNNKSILVVRKKNEDYSLEFLLGILNSPLIGFYHQRRAAKGNRTLFPKVVANDLKNYPLPDVSSADQDQVAQRVRSVLKVMSTRRARAERFEGLIQAEFGISAWPARLERWWRMDFMHFAASLRSKLTLQEKDQLLDFFELYSADCRGLDAAVARLEEEIAQLVYEIYGISEREIEVIEDTKPVVPVKDA